MWVCLCVLYTFVPVYAHPPPPPAHPLPAYLASNNCCTFVPSTLNPELCCDRLRLHGPRQGQVRCCISSSFRSGWTVMSNGESEKLEEK